MTRIKKVVAICGSTRKDSTNHKVIKAIQLLAKDMCEIHLFEGIETLPHFNPDLAMENTPKEVLAFRELIAASDGVLICTPEYAHGVPGTLKNAIDWTVTTADLDGKPTMLITASTDGREGHKSLLETLKVIQAKGVEEWQLLISFARTKVNDQFEFTDSEILKAVLDILHTYKGVL